MKQKLLFLLVLLCTTSLAFSAALTEGFETWPPTGWTIVQGACSPTNDIDQSSNYAYTGTYSARFSSYVTCSSGYDEYLITPELNTTSGDQAISFWYRKNSSGSEVFKVGWSSTGTDVSSDFTWGDEVSNASTTWQQYSKSDLPVGTKYVAIYYYSNYQYYLYVDDVVGPATAGVDNPTTFVATAASSSEIDLDWTLNASNDNVLVAWSSDGTFGTPVNGSTYGAGNSIAGGGTVLYYGSALHFDHQSLSSNTQYFYKAWSYDGSDYSLGIANEATTDFVFVTQNLPFTDDFETNLNAWFLSGTTTPEISSAQSHGGSNSLSFNTTKGTNSSVTVQLGAGTTPMLTFWYYIDYYSYNDLTVDIKEAGGSTWTTTIWQEATTYGTSDTWLEAEVDLSPYNTSGDFQLRFNAENTSSYSNYMVYMDDVSVVEVTCPAPTTLTENSITTNSATLAWTESGTATTWDIEYGETPYTFTGTPTITGTTTNPHALTGLSANTEYTWKVRSDCGGGSTSDWSSSSTFTTPCATYSTPFSENFNDTYVPACWFEATGDVSTPIPGSSAWGQSTNFANASGNSKGVKMNVYGDDNDWLISPDIDLGTGNKRITYKVAATSYNGTDVVSMAAEDNVYVLIKNASGTWDLANALADYTSGNTPSNTGEDVSIVLTGWSGIVNFAFYTKGSGTSPDMDIHFDDFVVETKPSCPAPTDLITSNITKSTATLAWTQGDSETQWEYSFGPEGYGPPTTTGTTVSVETAAISGLTSNQSYDWYVRANCGTDMSTWVGPKTFKTLCGETTAFPYTQDFENGGDMPDCWTQVYETGMADWSFIDGGHSSYSGSYPDAAYMGDYNACLYSSTRGSKTRLISPALDLSSGTSPILEFWHAQVEWGGDQDELRVYYKTSATGEWKLIPGAEWTDNISGWTKASFFLPEISAEYYLAFEATADYGYGVVIDDVTITAVPPVPVSNWALVLGIFLMGSFLVIRYKR